MKTLRVNCDPDGIDKAITCVKKGGVIVFPTDTVYGIGCNPYDKNAVNSIYEIKNRDSAKLFPILGFSKNELAKIAFFDERANKIADRYWPGEITLILKLKDKKLKQILNLHEKIAVRVPNNKCILSILKECKLIIGTSANISGLNSFRDPDECFKNISGFDLFVDGGIIPSSGESTIIEIDTDIRVLRQGKISEKEIREII